MFRIYYRLKGEEKSKTTPKPSSEIKFLEKFYGPEFKLIKVTHLI